jgi:hypothetical protein
MVLCGSREEIEGQENKIKAFHIKIVIKIRENTVTIRNDHTIMTAPLPVCSAKLSMI